MTVPAVKSLLVRARLGLVEASEARDADCDEIRSDLMSSYDRGVKASGRARRHLRTCDGCREYRAALRGIRSSFAALSPAGAGPLAMAGAKLLGFGGAGGGAAAGGSAAAGGGAAAAGGVATVSACKVAAVVCTAALTAGGAVEVRHLTESRREAPASSAVEAAAGTRAAEAPRRSAFVPLDKVYASVPRIRHRPATAEPRGMTEARAPSIERTVEKPAVAPVAEAPVAEEEQEPVVPAAESDEPGESGGVLAPAPLSDETTEPLDAASPGSTEPVAPEATVPGSPAAAPAAEAQPASPPAEHSSPRSP